MLFWVGDWADLWMYHLTTGWWTWLNGTNQKGAYGQLGVASASNIPGARSGHSMVIDGAKRALILFGGYGGPGEKQKFLIEFFVLIFQTFRMLQRCVEIAIICMPTKCNL